MATEYIKTCLHNKCQKYFTVSAKKKNQKFCSHICSTSYRRKYQYLEQCLNCGNILCKSTQKRFCCQSCCASYTNMRRTKTTRTKQRTSLLKTLKKTGRIRTKDKKIYRRDCTFKTWTKEDWLKIKGSELLGLYEMYCPAKNIVRGLVLDHMFSVLDGYKNKIDPSIISHPANCEIMLNVINSKKGSKSSISYEDLLQRIKNW